MTLKKGSITLDTTNPEKIDYEKLFEFIKNNL